MNMKQIRIRSILATVVFLAVIAIMVFVYFRYINLKSEQANEGSKNITVTINTPDEDPKVINLSTDAQYLRQALDEKELIKGEDSSFGFYITEVNNRVADPGNQEWWCITKGGEEVIDGVNQIVIQDQDQYELTLTIGY